MLCACMQYAASINCCFLNRAKTRRGGCVHVMYPWVCERVSAKMYKGLAALCVRSCLRVPMEGVSIGEERHPSAHGCVCFACLVFPLPCSSLTSLPFSLSALRDSLAAMFHC